MVWRILTNTERIRKRYTEGISDLDRDAKNREEKLKTQMQRKIDEATLIALKLCATIMEVEKNRRNTHNVLANHKVEVLADTRTKIKVLEKEIDRLQVEKVLIIHIVILLSFNSFHKLLIGWP